MYIHSINFWNMFLYHVYIHWQYTYFSTLAAFCEHNMFIQDFPQRKESEGIRVVFKSWLFAGKSLEVLEEFFLASEVTFVKPYRLSDVCQTLQVVLTAVQLRNTLQVICQQAFSWATTDHGFLLEKKHLL